MVISVTLILASTATVAQKTKSVKTVSDTAITATNQIGMLESGTMLVGELQNVLDSKNAKVGLPVILKTSSSVSQNGKVVIPEGVKLFGHVTEVQLSSGNTSQTKIGLVFDRLQKGNQSMPISAEVTSIGRGDGALAGIQLTPSTDGATTLSSSGGNLRLEKGTTFNLKVN
jgi:hypothetical protein